MVSNRNALFHQTFHYISTNAAPRHVGIHKNSCSTYSARKDKWLVWTYYKLLWMHKRTACSCSNKCINYKVPGDEMWGKKAQSSWFSTLKNVHIIKSKRAKSENNESSLWEVFSYKNKARQWNLYTRNSLTHNKKKLMCLSLAVITKSNYRECVWGKTRLPVSFVLPMLIVPWDFFLSFTSRRIKSIRNWQFMTYFWHENALFLLPKREQTTLISTHFSGKTHFPWQHLPIWCVTSPYITRNALQTLPHTCPPSLCVSNTSHHHQLSAAVTCTGPRAG